MRTVIVTGGGQGIGRITTDFLVTHGYRVAVWEADTDALSDLQQTPKAAAGQVLALPCDVSSEAQVRKATERTIDHFGRIDALINNAGIQDDKPLGLLSLDEWNRVLGVNLTGVFLCTKYAAPHLAEQKGSVVNISSTRALQSEPQTFAYSASKGGILALTHSLAVSLGPDIRVNCISPGWIDVSAVKKSANAKPEKLRPDDHAQHPAGRVGRPDDIARMVLFLISEENSFITGQNFIIDGGMTRKMIYV
ncbi:glucose 1-dehydrogenase [Nibrella viscosa]|uniref:Glucose 1-dehydrogenase n=1 Tax=Nibrella viscosa TaxID=1084524 RepID=A0ABP8L1H1_9BACT